MKKYIVYSVSFFTIPSVGIVEKYTIYGTGNYMYCYFLSCVVQWLNPKKNVVIK